MDEYKPNEGLPSQAVVCVHQDPRHSLKEVSLIFLASCRPYASNLHWST